MTSPSTAPAGWYPDAHTPGGLRYFDGVAWTWHVASATGPMSGQTATPGPSDPMHWLLPVGRTWQSIAAGYLAIFAMFIWPLGPFTAGLGIWALVESKRGGAHGRGRAIFAIVIGVLATLATALWIAS